MNSIFLSQLKKISEMNICLLNIGFYSWEVNVPSLHSWKFTICLLSVGFGISIDITHLILMESWEYHLWQPGYLLWLNGLPCQCPSYRSSGAEAIMMLQSYAWRFSVLEISSPHIWPCIPSCVMQSWQGEESRGSETFPWIEGEKSKLGRVPQSFRMVV